MKSESENRVILQVDLPLVSTRVLSELVKVVKLKMNTVNETSR